MAELRPGDRFVVRPGEKIATDGIVEEGESALDQSMLTGESAPVEIEPGADVVGGTINTYGRLIVRTTKVGGNTALAQIARLVEDAQSGKAPVQRIADRISAVFVPIVIGISLATLAGWLLATGDASTAFTAAVSVLIIACPCALGLATPTALLVGTGRGAQLGILIKGPEVLEETRRIQTIVLDKTGTITKGKLELVDIHPLDGAGRRRLSGSRAPSRPRASILWDRRSPSPRAPRSARFPPSPAFGTSPAWAFAAWSMDSMSRSSAATARSWSCGTDSRAQPLWCTTP